MAGLSRILHVEDDDDIREIALIALETVGGFVVEQCSSGLQAISVAPEFKPDLFLLDVMMPGMSGQQTLTALRQEAGMQDIPAIFMTAKVQPEEISRFKSWGAVDVISKPFDPVTLSDEIRAIWSACGLD